MRVTVLVQSAAFLDSAGARIRYKRFGQHLGDGVEMTIEPLDDVVAQGKFTSDAYVFVKTFTSKALILAAHLRSVGKWVGHDLFDDYFSQFDDARLAYFRGWLRAAARSSDFAVCTTATMRNVAEGYMPQARLQVVPDPFPAFDLARVTSLLAAKAERMRASRRIEVVWFGIGDNPYFKVGLQDLAAQAAELAQIRRAGWDFTLKVLTNRRALSADGLALLRNLPVPVTLGEWSEAAELAALEAADMAFLPVSGQAFSRAKSLNRAITALSAGAQVLSSGFPLYAALGDVIYRSAEELVADVERGAPKVSAAEAGRLMAVLRQEGDPVAAAEGFIAAVTPPAGRKPTRPQAPLCVMHGISSASENHKLAGRLKALSVRSPFHNGQLNYAIRFDAHPGGFDVFVERSLLDKLPADLPVERATLRRIVDKEYGRIDGEALGLGADLMPGACGSGLIAAKAMAYPRVMRAVSKACERLIPGATVVISEASQLAPLEAMLAGAP